MKKTVHKPVQKPVLISHILYFDQEIYSRMDIEVGIIYLGVDVTYTIYGHHAPFRCIFSCGLNGTGTCSNLPCTARIDADAEEVIHLVPYIQGYKKNAGDIKK